MGDYSRLRDIPLTEDQKTAILASLQATADNLQSRLDGINSEIAAITLLETITREDRDRSIFILKGGK